MYLFVGQARAKASQRWHVYCKYIRMAQVQELRREVGNGAEGPGRQLSSIAAWGFRWVRAIFRQALAAAIGGRRSVCGVDLLLIGLVGQRDTLRLAIGPCWSGPGGAFAARRRQVQRPGRGREGQAYPLHLHAPKAGRRRAVAGDAGGRRMISARWTNFGKLGQFASSLR